MRFFKILPCWFTAIDQNLLFLCYFWSKFWCSGAALLIALHLEQLFSFVYLTNMCRTYLPFFKIFPCWFTAIDQTLLFLCYFLSTLWRSGAALLIALHLQQPFSFVHLSNMCFPYVRFFKIIICWFSVIYQTLVFLCFFCSKLYCPTVMLLLDLNKQQLFYFVHLSNMC